MATFTWQFDVEFGTKRSGHVDQLRSELDNPALERTNPATNMYSILDSIGQLFDTQEERREWLREQRHLDSATSEELELIGFLVGIQRKLNESDDRLRERIRANFIAGTGQTTHKDIIDAMSKILNTETTNVQADRQGVDDPVVFITLDEADISNSDLQNTDIADIGNEIVPAGHAVQIQTLGTFTLKNEGESSDANKGLTSDSISTGGTLSTSIQ